MSFLFGKQEQLSNVSGPTGEAFNQLLKYITSQGYAGLNPATAIDSASAAPYQELFKQQNLQNFAQAKESAGNLTGSGVGNILGKAAGRASTEQGAFLADLFERRRQADANRFLSLVLGAFGSPAGGVTNAYRPGLLDYAGQGATALASGGAFNSLFNKREPVQQQG